MMTPILWKFCNRQLLSIIRMLQIHIDRVQQRQHPFNSLPGGKETCFHGRINAPEPTFLKHAHQKIRLEQTLAAADGHAAARMEKERLVLADFSNRLERSLWQTMLKWS